MSYNVPDENHVLNVFRMYIGLKLHFRNGSNFIYTDNFGSDKINEYSMNSRKDIDTFIKVAGTYDDLKLLKQSMITMFKFNKDAWIGEVLTKSSQAKHQTRMTNINSLKRVVEKEVSHIQDYLVAKNLTMSDILNFNNDRPIVVKELKLSDEVLALLDFKFDYLSQTSKNPLWTKRSSILIKYKYLITDYKDILVLLDVLK